MNTSLPMPVVRPVQGTSRAQVVEGYTVKSRNWSIRVPAGFITDWASVPRVFWRLFPPWGPWSPAALVHDWLYFEQPVSRKEADLVFLDIMRRIGVPFLTRRMMYWGVRVGGWHAWRTHARRRASK